MQTPKQSINHPERRSHLQSMSSLTGLDDDKQVFFYLTWLIWATVVFSAIAKLAEGIALWSYQREQAVQ
ncbi:MAG: hypothetical protein WBM44_26155 [Waterburya sp.]